MRSRMPAATARRVRLGTADDLAALMHTYADRSRATASPVYRVWVDRERARFGAWYEMFPRSAGPDPTRSATFREASAPAAGHRRPGLRRRLPAADSSDRHEASGRDGTTACRPQPGDPGQPVGDRLGGRRPHRHRAGARHARRLRRRSARRPSGSASRSRSISRGSARPITRGCASTPTGSATGPTARSDTRRTRRRSTRTSTRSTSSATTGRRCGRRCSTVTLFWVDRGVRIFRVDNPHTKTFGFWEWLIGEVHAREPRRHLSLGGVHAPGGDALSGQGRLHAVVHATSPGATPRPS